MTMNNENTDNTEIDGHLHLNPMTMDMVEIICDRDDMTISDFVQAALDKYILEYEKDRIYKEFLESFSNVN